MIIRCFFLFLCISNGLSAQHKTLPPIIKKLIAIKGPVLTFQHSIEHLITDLDLPANFTNSGQFVLKTEKDLLVLIPGTGRVYRLDTLNNGYNWSRIDSTYFTGYNYGCIYFSMDSTLYSFGGNGFWHTNGDLRHFNKISKEWNARPVSEPIYFTANRGNLYNQFYLPDTNNKRLFIIGLEYSADNTIDKFKDAHYKNKLYSLDVKTGIWELIGKVKDSTYTINGLTPWGLLVNASTFIDIKNNQINKLSDNKMDYMMSILGRATSNKIHAISFFADSTLYFGDFDNIIDSIKITSEDIVQTKNKFYSPTEIAYVSSKENIMRLSILCLSILSILLFLKLYFRKNETATIASIGIPAEKQNDEKKIDETLEKEIPIEFRSSKILDLLEEREKSLLAFIYIHSKEERLTTIEEINKTIGASNRTAEIQKRLRSDLITSINEKLSLLSSGKKTVIDKQRSEFDKRSFEYFIRPEHMAVVERIIGTKI